MKTYKTWKEAEAMLTKKRENKAKLELAHKTDKISQAEHEITEVSIFAQGGRLLPNLLPMLEQK